MWELKSIINNHECLVILLKFSKIKQTALFYKSEIHIKQHAAKVQGTANTVFGYSCPARCLGSQIAAALPCLTQRVEHFVAFRVLYEYLFVETFYLNPKIRMNKRQSIPTFMIRCVFQNVYFIQYLIHSAVEKLSLSVQLQL